jgi:alcohol dehydrogenase (cytochrome c)
MPRPDLDGSGREGDNLFAASVVAIDAKTGKYRWHFQQVRHDIWDYDSPSPVVLFDTRSTGKQRKAIAETSKTGWTYVLDRETGKPLLPVEDTPVPQDPTQKTAATQPIPQYDPFFSHDVDGGRRRRDREARACERQGRDAERRQGNIYAPFGNEVRVIVPGPQGGTNWQPMSYSPDTGYLYVCGMRSVSGYTRSGEQLPPANGGRWPTSAACSRPPASARRQASSAPGTRGRARRSGRSAGPSRATRARSRRRAGSSSSVGTAASSRPTTRRP